MSQDGIELEKVVIGSLSSHNLLLRLKKGENEKTYLEHLLLSLLSLPPFFLKWHSEVSS